jgi:atypical dual specificity phosphatase
MWVNFSWLVPERLAGAGWMGYGDQLEEDLDLLYRQGVRAVVSLTKESLPEDKLAAKGMNYLHLSMRDMAPPTLEDISSFVAFVQEAERSARPVVVHCGAGLGRTGTMLACYLVSNGCTAREAIWRVRHNRPGSVETPEQEMAVWDYEFYLKDQGDVSNIERLS